MIKKVIIALSFVILAALLIFVGTIDSTRKIGVLGNKSTVQSVENNIKDDGNEPPTNPYLADSPWPMSHRNPYCQASTPYAGPSFKNNMATLQYRWTLPGIITISFGNKYKDGSRAVWTTTQRSVVKAIQKPGGEIIMVSSMVKKDFHYKDLGNPDTGKCGAYNLVDRDNIYFVPGFTSLNSFGDTNPDDPNSPIMVKGSYAIPVDVLSRGEKIVGITLTYDGYVAVVTDKGLLAIIDRKLVKGQFHRFTGEEVSNSIACDENGGIYIVTSKYMHKIIWTGKNITTDERHGAWKASYETGGDVSGIRLGEGSGSTPTLMGTGNLDKFVVITDGQKLMHLVLFWRDQIPADWKQIPGTRDRRIAVRMPVTFGDPKATRSLSEQSVCVRGCGILVVNNLLTMEGGGKIWSVMRSGNEKIAPYGIERFQWDPGKRRIKSVWANREISFPNGIPSISVATNAIYNVGQRKGTWTFEAVNWDTGESLFHVPLGASPLFNSIWAATVIGPQGILGSGASLGFMVVGE